MPKTGSNEVSAKNVLKSAENYYASSLIKKDVTYPKRINFPDSKNELGIKGTKPDSGYIEIYEDGSVEMYITYDNEKFIKFKENEGVIDNKFIATSDEWMSDGNGLAYQYKKMQDLSMPLGDFASVIEQFEDCQKLSTSAEIKSCFAGVDISMLPDKVRKEMETYKVMANTAVDTGTMPTEDEIKEKMPIYYNALNGEYDDSLLESKIKTFYLPSVIVHEDGTLEKITSIGLYQDENKVNYLPFLSEENQIPKGIVTLVVPDTLETIGDMAFSAHFIKNIDFSNAKSLKTIGVSAFYNNPVLSKVSIPANVETIKDNAFGEIPTLKTVVFEGALDRTSKLNTIGVAAFAQDYPVPCGGSTTATSAPCTAPGFLEGTLYIPASVTKIGNTAFTGMNKLTVVFVGAEDGTSKLNEIGMYAFYNIANKATATLPSSVTQAGNHVFK